MSRDVERVQAVMRVLVTSAYADPEQVTAIRGIVAHDFVHVHTLAMDLEETKIALVNESSPHVTRVSRRQPRVGVRREYRFLYNEHDWPWCVLPGLYFPMTKA